jgi:hypothetical protein
MAYSQITPIIGQAQQSYAFAVDNIQREILGTMITSVDNYYGFAELKYVAFPASVAIPAGSVVSWIGFGGAAAYQASVVPVTANTGRTIGIVLNAVPLLAAVQYGWIMISGNAVVKAVASVPAGTSFGIDITVPGSVNAVSAGRQVLNAVSNAPSTQTIVKTATITGGSPKIVMSNVDGVVPGLTISGTGVSGTVLSVDFDNRTILSTANSTVGGNATVTFTYTGFIVAQINRSLLQGAIT